MAILRNCPFCGGGSHLIDLLYGDSAIGCIKDPECFGYVMRNHFPENLMDIKVDAWNRRATDSAEVKLTETQPPSNLMKKWEKNQPNFKGRA